MRLTAASPSADINHNDTRSASVDAGASRSSALISPVCRTASKQLNACNQQRSIVDHPPFRRLPELSPAAVSTATQSCHQPPFRRLQQAGRCSCRRIRRRRRTTSHERAPAACQAGRHGQAVPRWGDSNHRRPTSTVGQPRVRIVADEAESASSAERTTSMPSRSEACLIVAMSGYESTNPRVRINKLRVRINELGYETTNSGTKQRTPGTNQRTLRALRASRTLRASKDATRAADDATQARRPKPPAADPSPQPQTQARSRRPKPADPSPQPQRGIGP